MKRRRMTSAEVGSLKKAMVAVAVVVVVVVVGVEVKVGVTRYPNCHFCKKIWYLKSELYLQPTQATIVHMKSRTLSSQG